MSGHSKWSTIKRKKEKTDGARAKVFTKIGREIAVAVRDGGPDPSSNSKLKDIIVNNVYDTLKKITGEDKDLYKGYTTGFSDLLHSLSEGTIL